MNTIVILNRVKEKAPNLRAGSIEMSEPIDQAIAAPKAAKLAINKIFSLLEFFNGWFFTRRAY